MFSIRAAGKSLFNRFVSSIKDFFKGPAAEDTRHIEALKEVAVALSPAKVTPPAPVLTFHRKTKRIPGKARPSGSKLARKAANGTVGIARIR